MADEELDALAGELVLGLLSGDELTRAQTLRVENPDFARTVGGWELRLMPMAEVLPPVSPPAHVWERIEAAARAPAAPRRRRWTWGLSLGGLAAAAAVVLVALNPWRPHGVAMLASADGNFAVEANSTSMIIRPEQVSLPAGKSAELWLIAPGHAPKPLGLLEATADFTLPLQPGLVGSVLAISLEPPGGSPTGLPTGPVIAKVLVKKL